MTPLLNTETYWIICCEHPVNPTGYVQMLRTGFRIGEIEDATQFDTSREAHIRSKYAKSLSFGRYSVIRIDHIETVESSD